MGQFQSRTYETYIEEVKAKRKNIFITKTDIFKNIYTKKNQRIYNTNESILQPRRNKNKKQRT